MQEPATCAACPAQQASLQIESADTDAMGTLTERIAQSSDPARIAFALRIEEKRAVLVRIFQPVQAVELLRVEHSITWRRYTKAKSNCSPMTASVIEERLAEYHSRRAAFLGTRNEEVPHL